ncbi:hypothetical protein BJY01DRAFT_243123 [Aspergillus pseudoustus]|uniref:F-box domain-containing protein n=1 Tax=Aspergillus pseudoustus TaxID=1810923 RepID=A0ABR4KXF2_9EURO
MANHSGRRVLGLERLPPELMLCITDHLSLENIVYLTICSHTLHRTVRKPYFVDDKSTVVSVFTRIAAGLPHMFCYHRCGKLHLTADVTHPASLLEDIYHPCRDIGLLYDSSEEPLKCLFRLRGLVAFYHFQHCHLITAA